ncbi:MAG: VWA domain-containing protein [Bacteroidetes bacterium]|nr:MAG: VWA domain-containing protein [Bacteroidota bacterium]
MGPKGTYQYALRKIALGVILWELLFWSLFGSLMWMLGYWSTGASDASLGFKFPEKLRYLIVLIPMILSFLWLIRKKNTQFEGMGNERVRASLIRPLNSSKAFWSFVLIRNVVVFVILAAAQPVFGTKKVNATMEDMELVLAIDISNSMNTADIDPKMSRLEIVKRALSQLVNTLHGEKIGIVVFAGGAYTQLPLTSDYGAVKMYLKEVETDMLSNQGTNIAAALGQAGVMFSQEKTGKAILLITDGEDHEGGLDEAIKQVKEKGVSLAVMGVGTSKGGLIPRVPGRPERGYKTDRTGNTIVSRMDAAMVRKIASDAGGFSIICDTPYPNLLRIQDRFKQSQRKIVRGHRMEVKENWYQLPLFFALLCWLLFHALFLLRKND